MSFILFSSPISILMIVALNSPSTMLFISVSLRSLAVALSFSFIQDKFLHVCMLSKSLPSSVLENLVMSPAPESDGLRKKMTCSAQGLVLQGVISRECATCAMLWCFSCCVLEPVNCRGSPCLLRAVCGPWPDCGKFSLGMLWSACEMRPETNSTRTEALQNSLVVRLGVG